MLARFWLVVVTVLFMICSTFVQNILPQKSSLATNPPEGMVLIPGGTFEMGITKEEADYLTKWGEETGVPHIKNNAWLWFGDETPKHIVQVDSFYMDKHEVTNGQFERFVDEAGYRAEGKWRKFASKDRINHPVVNVSWYDAKAYAEWAGKRLPAEEEWEYAARGGRDVKWFPWGDSLDVTKANFGKDKGLCLNILRVLKLRKPKTTPVGNYPPNGFGLYDMGGNVREWCENIHLPYPGGPEDPEVFSALKKGPEEPRVLRGGYWQCPSPVFMRINCRSGKLPHHFDFRWGFRCAKSK